MARFIAIFLLMASFSCSHLQPLNRKLSSGDNGSEKIIFDTDSAFFNDDGAALTMLVRSGKFNILGITITAGNHWIPQGTEYMLHVLGLLRSTNIPVYLGESSPIKNERQKINTLKAEHLLPGQKRKAFLSWTGALSQPDENHIDVPFGGEHSSTRPEKENAVDFIIRSIETHPQQITILALGPMTNIAAAIKKAPHIQDKIKRLVFMGGAAFADGNTTPYAEFNFWFDADAAKFVMASEIPEKVMFGLDITNHALLRKSHFDEIVATKTPVSELYNEDLGNRWPGFNKKPTVTSYVWDCLAAGYLIDADFVTKRQTQYISVQGGYEREMGRVLVSSEPKPNYTSVQIMLDLDFERFFKIYKALLTSPH